MIDESIKLDLVNSVFEKTIASQIIPVEDIPGTIEKILTNYSKRNINVTGDGLTQDMSIKILSNGNN